MPSMAESFDVILNDESTGKTKTPGGSWMDSAGKIIIALVGVGSLTLPGLVKNGGIVLYVVLIWFIAYINYVGTQLWNRNKDVWNAKRNEMGDDASHMPVIKTFEDWGGAAFPYGKQVLQCIQVVYLVLICSIFCMQFKNATKDILVDSLTGVGKDVSESFFDKGFVLDLKKCQPAPTDGQPDCLKSEKHTRELSGTEVGLMEKATYSFKSSGIGGGNISECDDDQCDYLAVGKMLWVKKTSEALRESKVTMKWIFGGSFVMLLVPLLLVTPIDTCRCWKKDAPSKGVMSLVGTSSIVVTWGAIIVWMITEAVKPTAQPNWMWFPEEATMRKTMSLVSLIVGSYGAVNLAPKFAEKLTTSSDFKKATGSGIAMAALTYMLPVFFFVVTDGQVEDILAEMRSGTGFQRVVFYCVRVGMAVNMVASYIGVLQVAMGVIESMLPKVQTWIIKVVQYLLMLFTFCFTLIFGISNAKFSNVFGLTAAIFGPFLTIFVPFLSDIAINYKIERIDNADISLFAHLAGRFKAMSLTRKVEMVVMMFSVIIGFLTMVFGAIENFEQLKETPRDDQTVSSYVATAMLSN